MSAEAARLVAAATVLRKRAVAAVCPCGGPVCNVEHGWFREGELIERFDGSEHAVPFILIASPAMGLAVADWLDAEADDRAEVDAGGLGSYTVYPDRALAVADAVLGDAS